MTTCLILAAGDAERHNGGNKPLLEVDGETLLERSVRHAKHRGWKVYIVTHRDDLSHPDATIQKPNPEERRWVIETLLQSRFLWNGPTVVLLGDVFYTDRAFHKLFVCRNTAGFGKEHNIHAITISEEHADVMADDLRMQVRVTEMHPRVHGAGKLWLFLSCHPSIPVIDFGDETTDFDSPHEYKRFIEKYASRTT